VHGFEILAADRHGQAVGLVPRVLFAVIPRELSRQRACQADKAQEAPLRKPNTETSATLPLREPCSNAPRLHSRSAVRCSTLTAHVRRSTVRSVTHKAPVRR
jgi:hypothetical protein